MQIKNIIRFLEDWAPPSLQESYDNSGLIIGDKNEQTNEAIITLDVTEEVIDEAISNNVNFIIAHHPLIFSGIKKINTTHWVDKCIRKAVKNDINIYAIHTNLDNVLTGVNRKIAEKIGLEKLKILSPKSDTLLKLTVFVPEKDKDAVLTSMFESGAGEIGNYEHCSFQSSGEGSFKPSEKANPAIGKIGEDEVTAETRIEVMVKKTRRHQVLDAMKSSHPYEEVAYYLSELVNPNQEVGSGVIGELEEAMNVSEFLSNLKKSMNLQMIKHTKLVKEKVKKVALCGGSGRFLLEKAIAAQADVYISSDFKYHDFFEANDQIIILDIGHYESEVFTKELIYEKLTKNFTKFAFRLSEVVTNPIKYTQY